MFSPFAFSPAWAPLALPRFSGLVSHLWLSARLLSTWILLKKIIHPGVVGFPGAGHGLLCTGGGALGGGARTAQQGSLEQCSAWLLYRSVTTAEQNCDKTGFEVRPVRHLTCSEKTLASQASTSALTGSTVFGQRNFRCTPKVFLPFADSLQSLTHFFLHYY